MTKYDILKQQSDNFFNNKKILYDASKDTWNMSNSSNNIWTTFKDYRLILSRKGYAKGFVSSNTRAISEHITIYIPSQRMRILLKKWIVANSIIN